MSTYVEQCGNKVIETHTHTLTNHLGLSFVNAGGERIECWQLLNADKKAVAVADFRNGKLERFDAASSVLNRAKEWLAGLQRHYNDAIARDYAATAKGVIEYADGSLRCNI